MNKFVIVDGLPYLFANGKTFAVRWDEAGFTVGAEVELASVPDRTYSELSVKAKCANNLDSIGAIQEDQDSTGNEDQDSTDFGEMTLAELKDYAKENNINLNGARTKDAIIEAIKAEQVVNPDADDR